MLASRSVRFGSGDCKALSPEAALDDDLDSALYA